MSAVPGEKFAHEDEGEPAQFVVSWGGGYEDYYEVDYPRQRLAYFLAHHVGGGTGDHVLTIDAEDKSGQLSSLPITLTYPRSGVAAWPSDRIVKPVWNEVCPGLEGSCNIELSGTLVPRYISRWWPANRVRYSYDKKPPRVCVHYRRLVDDSNGDMTIYVTWPRQKTRVDLACLTGSIGYPLYDMRQVVPELYRLGTRTWALRIWFFWLAAKVRRQDLARFWSRREAELNMAWRGIISRKAGGLAERSWSELHEIPDAERVDIVFDDDLRPLYAATDLHWRELWGPYDPRVPGEPISIQVMNTRAKELANNWQELSKVVEGWGIVILSRFARNQPPYDPHLEVIAELNGEGLLAADPIGMESHSPALFNVRIQRHLTSTDVREA
jgi:hypothetical protein